MSKVSSKPICRFISAGVTSSLEYRSLSAEGPSRLLFLFLLIHPHGGSFHVPGLYKVGPEALRETCGLPRRAFTRAYAELREKSIVQSDQEIQLLWMPAALRLMGPPANPNMVKGYCRSILQLPSCDLLDAAIDCYRGFLTELGPSFVQPFEEAFGNPSERVSGCADKPFANSFKRVAETYSNSNTDRDSNNQSNTRCGQDGLAELSVSGISCASIADGLNWPDISTKSWQGYVEGLPPLSKSDVLRARAAVLGRPDVRDPWAYFFAILKRQVPRGGLQLGAANAAEEGDPFSAYADGEVVTFND